MSNDNHDNITDASLIQKYKDSGSNVWLGKLLERYTLLVYGVCLKYLKHEADAKDGTQQVFEKVIVELDKYEVQYFKSWLYMIAKNHCLMRLRGKTNLNIEIDENTFPGTVDDESIELAKQKDSNLSKMEVALSLLNAEQKECITLFYLKKLSYKEVCDITGLDFMMVKSNIQNGKRNLKNIMQRLEN